jgi:FkbM family methyltransferase
VLVYNYLMINIISDFTYKMNKVIGKIFRINIKKINNTFEDAQRYLIGKLDIDLLIDGGANIGQYSSRIREVYKGRIISIEPIKRNYDYLKKIFRDDKNFHALNVAVGASNGLSNFYVSNFEGISSSIYKPKEHLHYYPDVKFTKDSKVKMVRIDDIKAAKVSHSIYLKLDIQGYELPALRGSIGILDKVNVIEVEVSFIENMYEGGTKFVELLSFLDSHYFSLYSISDFRRTKNGQIVYADLIFTKRNLIKEEFNNWKF